MCPCIKSQKLIPHLYTNFAMGDYHTKMSYCD